MSALSTPTPGTLPQLLGTSRPLSWINTAYPFAAAYLLACGGVDTALLVGTASCQIISNVPSAVLLSRFTSDYRGLLVAVNIGGLGTPVASLASLITLGEYRRRVPGKTLRRPISICDAADGMLRFVFQVRGGGTARLAKDSAGDAWDILAPLGHGFSLPARGGRALGGGRSFGPGLAAGWAAPTLT